ncbi:MAG TPA: winged helix-turn-helix domain-containing protein [Pseudonocardiaceae bacterium]|nr:winged helix-turn-helix domain-containing protein [Pseudonocardiaceae bacterium]
MPDDSRAVLDAKGLRVLAHPARVQLVYLLRKHGPATATRLAERMGVNSGTASYHLRQLAAGGFVEEVTDRGNARERWWRVAHQQIVFDDTELAAADPESALAYLQAVAANYTLHTHQALNDFLTMPRPWQDVFEISEHPLLLSVDEAARLKAELAEVVGRYRRDRHDLPADAPTGAERVAVMIYLHPELDVHETP